MRYSPPPYQRLITVSENTSKPRANLLYSGRTVHPLVPAEVPFRPASEHLMIAQGKKTTPTKIDAPQSIYARHQASHKIRNLKVSEIPNRDADASIETI